MDLHGTIITMEGPNAAGKETQTRLLIGYLRGKGYDVHHFAYPEYNTPTGELIKRYLSGEFGSKESLVEFAAYLYAADRAKNQALYRHLLGEGAVIVNDRYQESNWVFQTALIPDPEEQEKVLQWLRQIESQLLPSNYVFYLDVPAEISITLTEKRGGQDTHESDKAFMRACEVRYQELSRRFGWHRVQCVDRKRELLSVEEIHANLVGLV